MTQRITSKNRLGLSFLDDLVSITKKESFSELSSQNDICLECTQLGNEKCARSFFAQTFWAPPGVRDIPAKFPGHPRFLSSKPKEDKLSRAGTKFSATTPSSGRPPPHRAVSGPKKFIFVLFFLAWKKPPKKIQERGRRDRDSFTPRKLVPKTGPAYTFESNSPKY